MAVARFRTFSPDCDVALLTLHVLQAAFFALGVGDAAQPPVGGRQPAAVRNQRGVDLQGLLNLADRFFRAARVVHQLGAGAFGRCFG